MCIDFRCGNGFVSQHLLHRTQIRAAFNQMCGKTMSEGMWTHIFLYGCLPGGLFDYVKHTHPTDTCSR